MALYEMSDGWINTDLEDLYKGGELTDGVLRTGTSTNGETDALTDSIPVHKLILSMRSPVFKAMFYGSMSEATSSEVFIPDFDSEVVRQFVRYMYESKLPKASLEQHVLELLAAACKYQVTGLRILCEAHLCASLTGREAIDKVISILNLADLYELIQLKEQVLNYIKQHAAEVIATEGFLDSLSVPQLHDVIRCFAGQKLIPFAPVAPPTRPSSSRKCIMNRAVDEIVDLTDSDDDLIAVQQVIG